MIVGIIGLVTLILGFVIKKYWLNAAKSETVEGRRDEANKALANHDQDAVNRMLDDGVRNTPPLPGVQDRPRDPQ